MFVTFAKRIDLAKCCYTEHLPSNALCIKQRLDTYSRTPPYYNIYRQAAVEKKIKSFYIVESGSDINLCRWDLIYRYGLFIGEDNPGGTSTINTKKDSKKSDNARTDMLKAVANGALMGELC
ncbi:hypothetical protein BDC45DRAFT_535826 [Circinella umbellata]|nr:hypothetical protein BDC45DRAFT_535826 [Circinella umbellata]